LNRFQVCLLALLTAQGSLAATLVHNVRGYTMNDGERVEFHALEFEAGVVTRLYRYGDDVAASDADTRVDGAAATLLPGFIDAHGHVAGLGQALASVDMTGSRSEVEALQRVADFIAGEADMRGGWLRGGGWNQVLWESNAFPTRASLDALTGDRPAAFARVDGHALWVNSAALDAAGIDSESTDPDGGQIVRDADGEPTGVLIDNAMDAVYVVIGEPSVAELESQIVRGMQAAAATGMTAVHDAGISARNLQAYRNLQRRGELPIRAYPMLSVLDPANDAHLAAGPTRSDDGMLHVRSVKVLADGALGSRGAALHAEYSDQPGHSGLLVLSEEELAHHMQRSAQAGFQVNVHAIGDLANTRVLNEFEAIVADPAKRALRHRVEHAQILRPADISRFAELDVIASMQPTHATSDKNMAGDRLGEARLAGAYAWNSLLESGARLAGGSDFPVEPPDPLYGIHAAVTRTDRDGNPLGGWRPEEKLSRDESLSLFTEWAAYAGHEEQHLGRLLPGYAADFVLLSDDIFTMPAGDIWNNRVLLTVVGGRVVFSADDAPEWP
jgi:predicted amidohydrolase YtcJ